MAGLDENRALSAALATMDAILGSLDAGIVLFDANDSGCVIYCNQTAADLAKIPRARMLTMCRKELTDLLTVGEHVLEWRTSPLRIGEGEAQLLIFTGSSSGDRSIMG